MLRPLRRRQSLHRHPVLAPRVIGRDPFDVEAIWEDLYNRIKDYGPKGMSIAAITGIDIALWDIIGRACNKPVHKLIGGAFRTEVDPYATGLYFIDMDRLVEEAVEEARAVQERRLQGHQDEDRPRRPQARLQARRARCARRSGPDIKLVVDANHCFTVPAAIKLGRMLEELDIVWFEEPISPEDHRRLRRGDARARHGGGRRRERFHPLGLSRRHRASKAMDIVQPDVCAAGGITECQKIAALASALGVECVPHAWGSAVGLAATIHFLAAMPDQPPAFSDAADAGIRADAKSVPRPPGVVADQSGQGRHRGPDRRRPRHRDRSQRDRPLSRRLNRLVPP